MSKTKDLGHLAHLITYDSSGNVTLPANLTVTGTITGYATSASLGSYAPTSRTITINGTSYDLSADRSWTIAGGVTSFNTRTGAITLSSSDVTTALGYTPYNSTNPSGYITGINSTMVTNALGYTPYNSSNPNGYITSESIGTGNTSGVVGAKYQINDTWLRVNSDDRQFQIYGNARTLIYRTDGSTNPHGGGGYAHIFYYGGSSDSDRKLIINTNGDFWNGYTSTWYSSWHNQGVRTDSSPTFSQVYVNDWFRLNGDCGLYQQSYGGHFRRSSSASYGTWEIFGYNKGGYGGINIIDPQGYWNNLMYESGNGGIYQQNGNGWHFYYNRSASCMGINGSTTSGSYGMYVNRGIYATEDIVAYSDRRKKTNIETIDNPIEKLLKLRGVYYNRIEATKKSRLTGVIAQETEEVFPEVVTYSKDTDEYGVAYGNFAGLFIEGFKAHNNEIDNLKLKVKILEEQVDNLKLIINGITK